jgi:hypothetical protein
MVAVSLVIVYSLYYIYTLVVKSDLRTVTMLKSPMVVSKSRLDQINKDTVMPALFNGNEYSYSTWIYLNDFKVSANPKLIMFGNTINDINGDATPIFYMDPSYVTMHVKVKTNKAPKLSTLRNNLSNIHKHNDCDYVTMSINYVPLQRWVNVVLVVDNQYVQLFMDGELRKVVDITEMGIIENINPAIQPPANRIENIESCSKNNACCMKENLCCKDRLLTSLTNNKIFVGKKNMDETMDGYMSKVQFFNYAITIDHANILYQSGPLHLNVLRRLGLNFGIPFIGLRNPFYMIDDAVDSDEADADPNATA